MYEVFRCASVMLWYFVVQYCSVVDDGIHTRGDIEVV